MIRTLAALMLSLLATGCATMVNGRHQTLSVDSYPSGAEVTVDCGGAPRVAASTPARIEVLRSAEHCRITFAREGYAPKTIELEKQESRATKLNAAFGVPTAIILGLTGMLVGSTVNGAETGGEIGAEAGYALGSGAATALDKEGGGWKWVPGRLHVVLLRDERDASSDPQ